MRSAYARLLAGAVAAGLATGAAALAPTAGAAVTAPMACPKPFPVGDAKDGVTGTGFTVEKGTTPAPFSAKVLGRVTDGIAPGIDMIMAELDSPALTRAGGVWAGMSGSPVYSSDGRLIGSVSYGLAASSPIAGITPAEDLQKLLSSGVQTAKVKVSAAAARRIARTGEATAAEAGDGFEVLKVPVTVSGTSGKRYNALLKDLGRTVPNALIRKGGSRVTGATAGKPSDITAGSNFGAALSYGAVTSGGVGTTTFVCGDEAVAFGHPFLSAGKVNLSAHPADAVLVQPDPTFGPFKVANFGGVVGTVDQDRTTGIRAKLGADPKGFDVTTALTEDGGPVHKATTTIVYQPAAADLAGTHVLSLIDSLRQSYGPGSGSFTTAISGRRANGSAFTLTLKDHVASTSDLSVDFASQVYSTVTSLLDQPFEDITLTGIAVTGNVTDKVNQYRVTKLEVATKAGWKKVTSSTALTVSAGKTVQTRATLTRYRSTATTTQVLKVKVPAKAQSGDSGILSVDSGSAGFLDFGDDFEDADSGASSFPALLKELAAGPFSDQLSSTVQVDGTKTLTATTSVRKPFAIAPYSRALDLTVR